MCKTNKCQQDQGSCRQNLYEMVFLDEKKLKLIYCGVCHCEMNELQQIVVED